MTTFHQTTLSEVSDAMFLQLPRLFQLLELDFFESHHSYHLACPVHGGDNPQGCVVFKESNIGAGGWQCFTHNCQDQFQRSFFGFIRGVLSAHSDKEFASMDDTMKFCLDFLQCKIQDLENPKTLRREAYNSFEVFNRQLVRKSSDLSREEIRSRLEIPSEYFIKRGFSPEVLNEFDVGFTSVNSGIMRKRVVVPVYDEDYNYVSCAERLTHDNTTPQNPKWIYNKGFQKSIYLYGLNVAKEYIKQTASVILVEGQGDVWRMHEAGYKTCVGIFGSSINEDQLLLLEQSGALNIIILTDSDEAGNKACSQIIKKCGRRFNYYRPNISTKDVGDMPVDQLKRELHPQIGPLLVNEN